MIKLILFIATVNAMSFNQWKSAHKKAFGPVENLRRRFIFNNNLKYIEMKNKQISYKLSSNGPFMAMSTEEFKNLSNGKKETFDETISVEEMKKEIDMRKTETVFGNTIDYRNHWFKNYVTPVQDQGSCDSGYVFAAASLVESKMLLTYKSLSASSFSVSKGELLSCTKGYDGSNNDGCNGGSVVTLLKYMKNNGVGDESEFGYTTYDGNTAKCSTMTKIAKVGNYKTLEANDDVSAIQLALQQYGPLVAHLDAMDLQFYESGILEGLMCSSTETTQSVLIVGYGVGSTGGYFVCKNSYGTNWGEDGYFRITAIGNNCGLTKYVTYLTSVSKP